MEKTGPHYKVSDYLRRVLPKQLQALEERKPDMASLKQVKDSIIQGKAAEGPVSTYKYAQIPCPNELIHDKYLERIELYRVQKDFSQGEDS